MTCEEQIIGIFYLPASDAKKKQIFQICSIMTKNKIKEVK